MAWEGHMARMGRKTRSGGGSLKKETLRIPRCRRKDNIKIFLR
jgi:hypothetical protein